MILKFDIINNIKKSFGGGLFLEPFNAYVLDKILSHSFGDVGNVLDNIGAVDLDGNQVGRLQAAVQDVRVNLVLVVLDKLYELFDLFVLRG